MRALNLCNFKIGSLGYSPSVKRGLFFTQGAKK
uniref:Uncharacterized protein n=1 Tax=Myoviridae sp. ctKZW4 TaxID=2826639 RepID=A0A8S5NB43_9CAUD|nr:MAG TPA: hypothetical protein [Myoviridae sp. ctKZW4]